MAQKNPLYVKISQQLWTYNELQRFIKQSNTKEIALNLVKFLLIETYFARKSYLPFISPFGLTITPALSAKQPIHINN